MSREHVLAKGRVTYTGIENFVQTFARGDLNLLILLGSHGMGKSRIVHQALPQPTCWLDGNTSVFGLYLSALAPSPPACRLR